MNKNLENLIDEVVKYIDEELFDEEFNPSKSDLSEEDVQENRDGLRDLLEPYIEDSEFLNALRKVGVDNFEGYDDAVRIYGRPMYE